MKKYLFPVFTAVLFAFIGIFTKLIGGSINAFSLTFYRVLLSIILMFFILLKTSGSKYLDLKRKEAVPFLIIGALMAMTFTLFILAFSYAPVGNVIMIDYMYPVFVCLLGHRFLKEKIKATTAIGLLVASAGMFIIFIDQFQTGASFFGNVLALFSGLTYGIMVTYLKYEERVEESSLHTIFWPMLFACILLFPAFLYMGPGTFTPDITLYVLGLGIVSSGLGYIFFSESLKRIPAHMVSVVHLLIDPMLAVLLAFVLLGETITMNVLAGGTLIIAAALIMQKELHRIAK